MKIVPIASGSSGNCYFLSDGDTNILIDCGIPIKKIQASLWDIKSSLTEISGCLVSHSHGDHVMAAQKLADKSIDVYTSHETIDAAHLTGHRIHDITGGVEIGSLYIYPYAVQHDALGTLAFSVASQMTEERALYITDAMYFKYIISGVTHLMIEANYDAEIMTENAMIGRIDEGRAKRVVNTHMSIDTALKTIKKIDKRRLKEIWLLHLSKDNAGDNFKKRVQEITGKEVYIA